MIGRTLGHYTVLAKLGEGGMGVVYKARDAHLDRIVAIKLLPPEHMAVPDRRARFIQEAKAASALNHPNIITVHDIRQAEGMDFIVMEYVDGQTLRELNSRKRLKLREALQFGVQICDALAKAHAAGIVHRDLKPTNVMVTGEGLVKVLDFGLAKLRQNTPEGENGRTRTLEPHTAEGHMVGTVGYLPPEQIEGGPVDARSDIFSFGAVLYEMITGRKAFQRGSNVATLAATLQAEYEPLGPEYPRELERIVARCLRKDPERRWQSMADLKVALAEIREESESGLTAPPGLPRRRVSWGAILFAALLLSGGAGIWYRFIQAPSRQSQPRVVPFSTYQGDQSDPAFSADGNQVAFSWNSGNGDNRDIYVKQIGEETALRLTRDPAPDVSPAWSPDGHWIAFVRLLPGGARYYTVPALGGPERELADTPDPARILPFLPRPLEAWSPDSKWLAASLKPSAAEPFSLVLVNLESGERRRLTHPPAQSFGDAGPAFSPRADALVFGRAATYGVSDLHLLGLTTGLAAKGPPRQLTADRLWNTTPAWLPDGQAILYSSGPAEWAGGIRALWKLDPRRAGSAERLAFTAGQSVTAVALSRRGDRLVYGRQLTGSHVWRVPLARVGSAAKAPEQVRLISSTYTDHNPQYSPDGTRIVFVSSRSGSQEVWLATADGSEQVQLTHMGAPVTGSPRWSPDSEHIVFDSNAEGRFQLYTMSRNARQPVRLTSGAADEAVASWSLDGRWIYFASNRGGDWQIWKRPSGGGDAAQLTRLGGRTPFEARDGFVYYAKAYDRTDLWRVPAQGGAESLVVRGIDWQRFSVGRDGIYFTQSHPDRTNSIECYEFASGATRPVALVDGPLSIGFSVSPDGRSALVTKVEERGADLMLVENLR